LAAVQKEASDLHLAAGYSPTVRVHGHMMTLDHNAVMTPADILSIFQSITTQEQRVAFQRDYELDFFYEVPGLARMRTNACFQQGSLSLSFRIIPTRIPTMQELGLPEICEKLAMEKSGLVLVTGPTGVGKTTTMAAMINYINQHASRKIVTIEDPIEYVYSRGQSFIIQRNLGNDTKSFAEGVKRALRQDPNVILVGEMRDLETMSAALTAAETGVLVIATLHTLGAAATVERIVDVFPNGQAQQVRLQMALTLKAVLSQILLPRANSKGRVAAFEVMIGTPAIRNLIREGKTYQIDSIVEVGSNHGMHTLAQDVKRLVKTGAIRADLVKASIEKP
jgi:twitching motility protein PilT